MYAAFCHTLAEYSTMWETPGCNVGHTDIVARRVRTSTSVKFCSELGVHMQEADMSATGNMQDIRWKVPTLPVQVP